MLSAVEKSKILKAHSIGPKMVSWIEQAGYTKLLDFAGGDAHEIALRIEIETGNKRLNKLGIAALENLIAYANQCSND